MRKGYVLQLNKLVFVDDSIDLGHMLESVSDATFNSDNVTKEEQDLVIDLIQKIKQEKEKIYAN